MDLVKVGVGDCLGTPGTADQRWAPLLEHVSRADGQQ